jgi:hypothetical protein
MKRFIAGLTVTLGLVAGVSVVTSTPAWAALSDCSSSYVCIWDGNSYASGTYILGYQQSSSGGPASPGRCLNLPSWANDRANSFYNHFTSGFGKHVSFYENANCTGILLQYPQVPVPINNAGTFPGETLCCSTHRDKLTSIFIHTG